MFFILFLFVIQSVFPDKTIILPLGTVKQQFEQGLLELAFFHLPYILVHPLIIEKNIVGYLFYSMLVSSTNSSAIFIFSIQTINPNPLRLDKGSDYIHLVDPKRIELSTSALRTQRSPS